MPSFLEPSRQTACNGSLWTGEWSGWEGLVAQTPHLLHWGISCWRSSQLPSPPKTCGFPLLRDSAMLGPTDAPANDAENWFLGQMLIARTWSRWASGTASILYESESATWILNELQDIRGRILTMFPFKSLFTNGKLFLMGFKLI